jgi:hypothetical protein
MWVELSISCSHTQGTSPPCAECRENQLKAFSVKFAFTVPSLHPSVLPTQAPDLVLLAPHWSQHRRKGCDITHFYSNTFHLEFQSWLHSAALVTLARIRVLYLRFLFHQRTVQPPSHRLWEDEMSTSGKTLRTLC